MNRFFRVAYIMCFIYTFALLGLVGFAGAEVSIFCFAALYIGLLLFMLPGMLPELERFKLCLRLLGIAAASAGILFTLAQPAAVTIVYAAAACIVFVLALKLNYDTEHSDFAAKFGASLTVLALLIMAALLLSNGTDTFINQENMHRAVYDAVPCVIMAIVTGVMLLRGLRAAIGIVDIRQFGRRQLRDALIFFCACMVFWAADLPSLVWRGLSWLLSAALLPAVQWLARQLGLLFELMVNKHPAPGGTGVPITTAPTQDAELTPLPESTPMRPENHVYNYDSEFFRIITIIAASVIIIAVLWVIVSKLLKRASRARGRGMGYPNETREYIGDSDEEKAEKPVSRFEREPRRRIRYIYLTFMRHLGASGADVRRSDTCEDIEKLGGTVFYRSKDEIAELSDIYRSARYDTESRPTQQDAARAKEAYSRIKSNRGGRA